MEPNYRSGLVSVLATSQEDEWQSRTTRSAKHLLASICFREVTRSTYELAGSVLLSPIGFYYSIFHLSVAMLYVEYSTPRDDLRHLRHSKLRTLIQTRLNDRHIVDHRYIEMFRKYQDLREYANYVFGVRTVAHNFFTLAEEGYFETGNALDQGIQFILSVQDEVSQSLGMMMPIQIQIGDGFGDDLIRGYLSEADENRVREYLLEKDLST